MSPSSGSCRWLRGVSVQILFCVRLSFSRNFRSSLFFILSHGKGSLSRSFVNTLDSNFNELVRGINFLSENTRGLRLRPCKKVDEDSVKIVQNNDLSETRGFLLRKLSGLLGIRNRRRIRYLHSFIYR